MIIIGLSGYKKRTGFMAGLTVAQISEFSLILIALGISVGHLNAEILSFATVVGLITITGSSYMIIFSDKIFDKISKYLKIFEKKNAVEKENKTEEYEYLVFGYNRMGYGVGQYLKKRNRKFIVIDYNPETANLLTKENINHMLTEFSGKRLDLKRALLERGIDARQLRAKGFNVRETLRIFGLEDTTYAFGAKRVVNEFGNLTKTALMFGQEEVARSFGGIKKIVGEFSLEEAYSAFGIKNVNEAYGGFKNIMKILGPEEVIRAAPAAKGFKNYDELFDIKQYASDKGFVETARLFGVKYTGRALGLSTGDMKELARRLKKK